jgi:hypothetical protein
MSDLPLFADRADFEDASLYVLWRRS